MTRTYEELVAAGQRVINRNWELGDLALEVETSYGEGELTKFAGDIDVSYDSLKHYRHVASRFESGIRMPDLPWSIHAIFAAQDDRAELVQSRKWTAAAARDYVARRKNVVAEIRPIISSVTTSLGEIDRLLVDYTPNELQSRELAAELKVIVEMAWQSYGRLSTGNVDVELARLLGGAS